MICVSCFHLVVLTGIYFWLCNLLSGDYMVGCYIWCSKYILMQLWMHRSQQQMIFLLTIYLLTYLLCTSGCYRDRPAAIPVEVKSIDDTSNFDEFPDIDLKWRKYWRQGWKHFVSTLLMIKCLNRNFEANLLHQHMICQFFVVVSWILAYILLNYFSQKWKIHMLYRCNLVLT